MNQLIKITEQDGNKVVSAREVYNALGFASKHWAKWYAKNIVNNEFALDGVDFTKLPLSGRTPDFALNIDFAKRIAMMARTESGEKVRNYFIEFEKNNRLKPISTLDILEMTIQGLREQNLELQEVRSEVKLLQETVNNIQVVNAPMEHFSIMGYCRNIHKQIGIAEAKIFGVKCRALCNQMGYVIGKIPDPRFGTVNTYPLDVLKEIIPAA